MKGRNVLRGTCLLGQLTPKGYKQQYDNGRFLRESYPELLPSCAEEAHDSLYLRSDNQPRTIGSGQALIDGLFHACNPAPSNQWSFLQTPPTKKEAAPLKWTFMDRHLDNIFPNFHVCPALNRAVRDRKASAAFKEFTSKTHDPLMAKLKKMAVYKDAPKKLSHVQDCLATHVCHSQTLPKELASPALVEEIEQAMYEHYSIVAQGTRRLAGGPIVGDMLAELQDVVAGNSTVKLALYSGHDTGPILPLLFAFGVEDGKWPAYASKMVFELLQAEEGHTTHHAVRMVYNGKVRHIPGCGGAVCPWKKFEEIAAAIVPSHEECAEEDPELRGKCTHWTGMFAELAATSDLFGESSVTSA